MARHRLNPDQGFVPATSPRYVGPFTGHEAHPAKPMDQPGGAPVETILPAEGVDSGPGTVRPLPPDAFIYRSSGLMDAFAAIRARAAYLRKRG